MNVNNAIRLACLIIPAAIAVIFDSESGNGLFVTLVFFSCGFIVGVITKKEEDKK